MTGNSFRRRGGSDEFRRKGRLSPCTDPEPALESRRQKDPRKKAMDLLLYRDRTEQELRERLQEAGFSVEETQDALDYVSSFGYLNDRRYAENYVYSKRDRESRRQIRRELEEKGVADRYVEEALAQLPEDETDQIYALVCRRAGNPRRLEEKELRRLFGYLSRRGFASGEIWKAVQKFQEDMG